MNRTVRNVGRALRLGFAVLFLAAFALADDGGKVAGGGEKLFNDPALGTNDQSCASCHPGGRGLSDAGSRSEWRLGETTFDTLAGAVNFCITEALNGTALGEDSTELRSLVAYIESLGSAGGESVEPEPETQPEPEPDIKGGESEPEEEEGFGC